MTDTYTFDRRQLSKAKRDLWCKGLLSSEFMQIREAMCEDKEPKSACCLHVANIVVDGNSWESGIGCDMPDNLGVHAPFAETAADVVFYGPHGERLNPADLNDDKQLTFPQIAELIQEGKLVVAGN